MCVTSDSGYLGTAKLDVMGVDLGDELMDSTMLSHQEKLPYGRICLEQELGTPSMLCKSKQGNLPKFSPINAVFELNSFFPRKLTVTVEPENHPSMKRNIIFQTSMFRLHIHLWECITTADSCSCMGYVCSCFFPDSHMLKSPIFCKELTSKQEKSICF